MAPRRTGGGGAGAEVAAGGPRKNFEPPPLKRMYPWLQDGSGQCDIVAGGVDETGVFKGVYVSGVHLAALLRTFALSKTFMPVDTPTPVAALGQSLADGIPIVVVTRGCFGREMDYGPGPVRNDIQKAVWQACRDMRAEMPQILITCIDIPLGLGSDVVQGCLDAPLNEYRELMYHDGTWYTPQITSAASLGQWLHENKRGPLKEPQGQGKGDYNRKTFGWRPPSELYGNLYAMSWKKVLEVRAPPEVAPRGDLNFVNRDKLEAGVVKGAPSAAQALFKRALAKARESGGDAEVLAAVDAYLVRAAAMEKDTLKEAMVAAEQAGGTAQVVALKLLAGDVGGAIKTAKQCQARATTAAQLAASLKLVLDCHYESGSLDEALADATEGMDAILAQKDAEATAKAYQLVVGVHLARGDPDAAVASAREALQTVGATAGPGQERCKAEVWLLVAKAATAQAADGGAQAEAGAGVAAEAAEAYAAAGECYRGAGMAKEQASALRGAFSAQLSMEAPAQAAETARRLMLLEDGERGCRSQGLALLAAAHLASRAASGGYLDGGEDAMLASAREALALCEAAGDAAGAREARALLASALEAAAAGTPAEAAALAKGAVAGHLLGAGAVRGLLERAQESLQKGKLSSAYWFAKQALREAMRSGDDGAHDQALGIMEEADTLNSQTGKPFQVGGPVPLVDHGQVAFV
ncbi:unnamed protein product [Prorocentrum cordatum]|nr:unnamed protein product [Polarella glacialis]CAK0863601.1 unnamed protein product [Polarella glacialis]